jgi:UDP:flavonoid glycosyltransferase YjiC (YdhE family)
MTLDQTPFILIGSHPVYGHVQPLQLIASYLVSHGYEVTFLAFPTRFAIICRQWNL